MHFVASKAEGDALNAANANRRETRSLKAQETLRREEYP